jgi:hypothetical protein
MGVAYLILVLLSAEVAIAKALDARWLLLLILGIELYQAPAVNISALYTVAVLFLLLFSLLGEMPTGSLGLRHLESGEGAKEGDALSPRTQTPPIMARGQVNGRSAGYIARSTLLAITLASLISLKYSVTPAAGLLGITYFIVQLRHLLWRRTVMNAVFCAACTVVFLVPWMQATYQSSGTLFFGLLGNGYYGSRYGTAILPIQALQLQNLLAMIRNVQSVLLAILVVLAILLLKERRGGGSRWLVDFAIAASLLFSVAVIAVEMGGMQVSRYTFPILLPGVIFLLAERLNHVPYSSIAQTPNFVGTSSATSVLVLGLLLGDAFSGFVLGEKDLFSALRFSITGENLISRSELDEFRAMQETVPKGERLMVRLSKNFLPDFRRNPIYIVDNPGMVSPPPGMPAFRGPEPLATYLLGDGIRYVAYSYGDGGGLSHQEISQILDPKTGTNAFILSDTKLAVDFQENLILLGHTRKKLFDDGQMFVLDLGGRIRGS